MEEVIIEVVGTIFSICETIYKMAMKAKANKEHCQEVAQRVKALEELLFTIVERGPDRISSIVSKALKELKTTLESAEALMAKFSKSKAPMKFLKSGSIKDEFTKVEKRLTDTFQVLSGALLIEQGNVLNKVYDTVSGKRKPRTRTPLPMPLPTAPMPVSYMMPSMPVYSYMTPICLPRTMAPVSISTTFVSKSAQATPPLFRPTTAPKSVISITSLMTQNTMQMF